MVPLYVPAGEIAARLYGVREPCATRLRAVFRSMISPLPVCDLRLEVTDRRNGSRPREDRFPVMCFNRMHALDERAADLRSSLIPSSVSTNSRMRFD